MIGYIGEEILARKLLRWGQQNFTTVQILHRGKKVGTERIWYGDGENTALLNFTQERGFFAQGGRYGNTQYHFVNVICQLRRCRIQIKFNFWLPIFLENVRRVRRFERNILGINTLDLESHFGVVLF